MNLGLKNKVIVVTGGSKGIGRGISEVLAAEGARVCIVGRKEPDVLQAVEEIQQVGGQATYAIAELTDVAQCEAAVAKIIAECGEVYGLVNNAGVNDGVGLSADEDAFVESLRKNVVHYFTMARLLLPQLKANKGAIVNIGSKVSMTGQGGTSGYAAANGARNALTREWAVDLLPFSVRVNAVIVAECYTPLYQRWIETFDKPEEKLNEITRRIPLEQRMTTAEEIANMVAFLLSPKSSHTTGQLIAVDGGYTHLDRAINQNQDG